MSISECLFQISETRFGAAELPVQIRSQDAISIDMTNNEQDHAPLKHLNLQYTNIRLSEGFNGLCFLSMLKIKSGRLLIIK